MSLRLTLLTILTIAMLPLTGECAIVTEYSEDFSTVSTIQEAGFKTSGNDTASVVGGYVVTTLDRDTDVVNYRTEFDFSNAVDNFYFTNNYRNKFGREYIYEVDIKLVDYVTDNVSEIITQFHATPDLSIGEDYRSPCIAIEILNNEYLLRVRADSKKQTNISGSTVYERLDTYNLGSIVADINEWTTWKFVVRWNYTSDAYLYVYKNGVAVHAETGIQNCYNDDEGCYWKFGIYKWEWETAPSLVSTREVHYDNISIQYDSEPSIVSSGDIKYSGNITFN